MSSQQCLSQFKKTYKIKKIGHHGTLDPFASGLLLAGINEATKFFQFIDDSKKTYKAKLHLGVKTDTLDETGEVIEQCVVPHLTLDQIKEKILPLIGKIQQTPPMYSAIKVDGKRLYKLARQGMVVDRVSRTVEIFDIKLIEWTSPYLDIEVAVSRGTYIRVLAEQIAEKLGTIACLKDLKRTKLCGRTLDDAYNLHEELIVQNQILPIEALLSQYGTVTLSEKQKDNLYFGKLLSIDDFLEPLTANNSKSRFLAFYQGDLIGMLEQNGLHLKSLRLKSGSANL